MAKIGSKCHNAKKCANVFFRSNSFLYQNRLYETWLGVLTPRCFCFCSLSKKTEFNTVLDHIKKGASGLSSNAGNISGFGKFKFAKKHRVNLVSHNVRRFSKLTV